MRDQVDRLCAATGLSKAQLMLQGLGVVARGVGEARKRGYQEGLKAGRAAGYEQGAAENRVSFRCAGCKKPIAIEPGSPAAEAAANALERDGCGHTKCVG